MSRVVGMSCQNRERPIDLLCQYCARKLVRKGDAAERERQAGSGVCCGRPAVVGADRQDDGLGAGVAQTAEMCGEFFAAELLASAVQEDENRRRSPGLTFERCEERSLGVVGVSFAGDVAACTGEEFRGDGCRRLGLGACAGRTDGDGEELHPRRIPTSNPR